MNKVLLILGMLLLVAMPLISAQENNQYIYKVNEEMNVTVVCQNNGFCDNSSECYANIQSPTGDYLYQNELMDFSPAYYYLNLTPEETGEYSVTGYCLSDGLYGVIDYNFEITKSGKGFSDSESTAYLIVLGALIIFFFVSGYGAVTLKWKNKRNDRDEIIGVNDLKYVKFFLIYLSYFILIWIANIMITISNNYIHLGVAMKFFEVMFMLLTNLTYPIVILGVIFVVIQAVKDFKINKLLSRGFAA